MPMNAETIQPVDLPYNGKMIRWAREWRGRSVEEAAGKLDVDPEVIRAWENSTSKPTVAQARKLAKFYGRQFLEFFYDQKPNIVEPELPPDYRLHRGVPDPGQSRELLDIRRWAELQRINALELYESLQEPPPSFPDDLFATIDDDVEDVAEKTREAFAFPLQQQRKLTYDAKRDLPNFLRQEMEGVGVLVLRDNTLSDYGVSGLCMVEMPLPIIVFSTEAPARSAFTLMHEFAHIVLRESAISGTQRERGGAGHARKVERWCDRFAAAFLVPRSALKLLRIKPEKPDESIDDVALGKLAATFKVSPHAMLVRLVDLGYVSADYYWTIKRPQFLAEEANWSGGGRTKIWVSRIWNKVGIRYTGLVLEALGTGRIQPHQAQRYLGVSYPDHVTSIQQEFGGI
jgi:Zn-dependent peptidase ImmA (M78 family)/DNA-binding XRE family transcriptional regulator